MALPEGAFAFIVVALAVFRLTRFFVFDSLVGAHPDSKSKFSRSLDRWAFTQDAKGDDRSWLRGKVGTLLTCPWCFGFWITVAVAAAWFWGPDPVRWAIVVFALAAVAGLLNNLDLFGANIGNAAETYDQQARRPR